MPSEHERTLQRHKLDLEAAHWHRAVEKEKALRWAWQSLNVGLTLLFMWLLVAWLYAMLWLAWELVTLW